MEQRIDITIDADGQIKAATGGFKGKSCLTELDELLGEIDMLESFTKTDEYFQKVQVSSKSKTKIKEG
jgi:hypothetical protein